MSGSFKDYVVEYGYQGARWGATIKATSHEDAEARIRAMGAFGQISGELVATMPAVSGPLVRLIVWWRNFLAMVRP